MQPDPDRLDALQAEVLDDLGAAASGALVLLGDRLGLYGALAEAGPLDSVGLARRTGTAERYVREWLAAQAASGYIGYDAESGRYALSPEQAAVFADPDHPAFASGAFESVAALWRDEPKVAAAFRSGTGVGWEQRNPCLFNGTARFFRPAYRSHLVDAWLPALDGVCAKLERGALIADVGCGHGLSTLLMARAFPNSSFLGFDLHGPSIDRARTAAAEAGLDRACSFERADAKEFPGRDYDLVCFFDCLHDLGDPAGAAAHAREALAPGGTLMLVEPLAGDTLAENLNPLGRFYYAFSTMVCTPASRSQEVGACLGAQAGERRLRQVLGAAGFSRVRRAGETRLNLVLEARP